MEMRLLVHDLESNDCLKTFNNSFDDIMIISDDGTISNCIGCFGCWIKTPGSCVIRDKYGDMGEHLSKCKEFIIISKCYYGGFSPFIKNVLDRSISYVHPYFTIRNGEMHHRRRYKNKIEMKVLFYGENITDKEKKTAEKLVKGNAMNFNCKDYSISFFKSIMELEGKV